MITKQTEHLPIWDVYHIGATSGMKLWTGTVRAVDDQAAKTEAASKYVLREPIVERRAEKQTAAALSIETHVLLCAILLIAAAICLWKWGGHKAPETSGSITNQSGIFLGARQVEIEPANPLQRWLSVMEIWKCPDGGYALRTSMGQLGTFQTIEAARRDKTNRAQKCYERDKAGWLFPKAPPPPPDCQRIE
jgi:hypothetical protein